MIFAKSSPLLVLLSIASFFLKTGAVPVEQDLTMSAKEKSALDKFKNRVLHILPNEYMKKEIYLVNWIRAAKLDVDAATRKLYENLEWRKEHKIDELIEEDFGLFEQEFPIDIDGFDYTGRPVVAINMGDWDMRKIIHGGLQARSYQFSMRALEIASTKVRDAQTWGENVTRFQVIFNLDGYNTQQHGCLPCMGSYLNFITAFQKYYPGMVDNVIFINAPSLFYNLLQIIKNIAGPDLQKIVKVFGTNKEEWSKYLISIIPPDQLDKSMGGTKIGYR